MFKSQMITSLRIVRPRSMDVDKLPTSKALYYTEFPMVTAEADITTCPKNVA